MRVQLLNCIAHLDDLEVRSLPSPERLSRPAIGLDGRRGGRNLSAAVEPGGCR